jgi:hypothetical protein
MKIRGLTLNDKILVDGVYKTLYGKNIISEEVPIYKTDNNDGRLKASSKIIFKTIVEDNTKVLI